MAWHRIVVATANEHGWLLGYFLYKSLLNRER